MPKSEIKKKPVEEVPLALNIGSAASIIPLRGTFKNSRIIGCQKAKSKRKPVEDVRQALNIGRRKSYNSLHPVGMEYLPGSAINTISPTGHFQK